MTDQELRDEITRRLRSWERVRLQSRKFALLVVGYCRRQFWDRWGDRRRDLLRAAERTAGQRPHSPTQLAELQELARHLQARANQSRLFERYSLEREHAIPTVPDQMSQLLPSADEPEAIRLLALSLYQPDRAAEELIESPLTSLPLVLDIMECLRPARWEESQWVEAELPVDAHKWARQIYDTQDYSSLPILADRLQEAGCSDEPLLGHCRCHGQHVKGCAVVDWLCGYQA